MADELKLLQEFEPLPEALAAAVEENGGVMPLADDCPNDNTGCNADTSDCSSDGSSCTSDGCSGDSCSDCADLPDPAPTFTISRVTQSSARITISNPSAYYMRIFVRRDGSTTAAVDEWIGNPTSKAYDLVRLDPDTTYVVNIAYNTSQTSVGAQFVGAQSFTTEPLPKANSGTRIHDSTAWVAQQPFIWDGTAWTAYSTYIWDGTAWSPY